MSDIYCAFGEEERAETTPGKNIINMTNPMSRLIVRDLEKYFDNFIVYKLSIPDINSQITSGSMIEPVGYTNELQWFAATIIINKMVIP